MKAAALLQVLTLRGHSFFPATLNPASVVVDLGAHRGEFARRVRARFGCRCIAVEANPHLVREVRGDGIEAVECAVAGEQGVLPFYFSNNPEASSLNERAPDPTAEVAMVRAVTLPQLLADAGVAHVDLLKVDIEGAEVAVIDSLTDAQLACIDQITIEWHDFCGLVTPADIDRISKRLERLGFDHMRFGSDNLNWLFVRRTAVGSVRRTFVKRVVRPTRNLLHRFRNATGLHHIGLSPE